MNYGGPYPPPPPFHGPHPQNRPPYGYPHMGPPMGSPIGPPMMGSPNGMYPMSPMDGYNPQGGQSPYPMHPHWPGHGGPPFQQGRDGWWYPISPIPPQALPIPQISPRPPIPATLEIPFQPTPPATPPKAMPILPKIDDYWKGRIVAPLSGPSIPKRFVTLSTQRPVTITKPDNAPKNERPKLQLLPPRSYPPIPNTGSEEVSCE